MIISPYKWGDLENMFLAYKNNEEIFQEIDYQDLTLYEILSNNISFSPKVIDSGLPVNNFFEKHSKSVNLYIEDRKIDIDLENKIKHSNSRYFIKFKIDKEYVEVYFRKFVSKKPDSIKVKYLKDSAEEKNFINIILDNLKEEVEKIVEKCKDKSLNVQEYLESLFKIESDMGTFYLN